MSNDTTALVVVGAGLVSYVLWRQQQAKAAAAAAAAATTKRTTTAKNGIASDLSGLLRSNSGQAALSGAVGGLAKWLGSSGQNAITRSASASLGGSTALTGGYFAPSPLKGVSTIDGGTRTSDYYGAPYNFGDDSNSGAVVDPAEYAYMDQLY